MGTKGRPYLLVADCNTLHAHTRSQTASQPRSRQLQPFLFSHQRSTLLDQHDPLQERVEMRRISTDLKMTWGCFSCRNPRIAMRVHNCPVCNQPRTNRRFGVHVEGIGYFLCNLESANLAPILNFTRVDGCNVDRKVHSSAMPELDEADWRDAATRIIVQHFNPHLKQETPRSLQPPASMSLFEQVIYNARMAQQAANVSPGHTKGSSPRKMHPHHHIHSSHSSPRHHPPPHQLQHQSKPSNGFRYLQQMHNEQAAVKKVVQHVIDRRLTAIDPLELVDKDLPEPGERRCPCPMCEREFPATQMPGKVTWLAVQNWKAERGVPRQQEKSDSNYLRAFSVIKRQNAVALCVYCSQFFDENLGDSLDKESVKEMVGVEHLLKGPLNRPNSLFKAQMRASSTRKVVDSPRSQDHAMAVQQLRSRSAQRISSLSQARHIQNKYFDLSAAQSMLDLKKARAKEAPAGIERRYYPIVSIPKQQASKRTKRAPVSHRYASTNLSSDLDAQKAKELKRAAGNHPQPLAHRARSLSPKKQPKPRMRKMAASVSPVRSRKVLRQVSGAQRGVRASQSVPRPTKGAQVTRERAVSQVRDQSVERRTVERGRPTVHRGASVSAKIPAPTTRPVPTVGVVATETGTLTGPAMLPPILFTSDPVLPGAARKPLLFAVQKKTVGTVEQTDGPATQVVVVESLSSPAVTAEACAPRAPCAEDTIALHADAIGAARPLLRGKNKFKLIRSQQLAEIRAQNDKAREAATTVATAVDPAGAHSSYVPPSAPSAEPSLTLCAATPKADVGPGPLRMVLPLPLPLTLSLSLPIALGATASPSAATQSSSCTPKLNKPTPKRVRLLHVPSPRPSALSALVTPTSDTNSPSAQPETRDEDSSVGRTDGAPPNAVDLHVRFDSDRFDVESVPSEPIDAGTPYADDFEDEEVQSALAPELRRSPSRLASRGHSRQALHSGGGDGMHLERIKLLSRGADAHSPPSPSRTPIGKHRATSSGGGEMRRMQLL